MTTPILLNPNGQLLPSIIERLHDVRKTKPIWARRIDTAGHVATLEGQIPVQPGDFLCRGIADEYWPQKESKLLDKYNPTGQPDSKGWQRFDPKPDSRPVEAAQVEHGFQVIAQWGQLLGKPGDFIVRSKTDPTDVWLVDQIIFQASYEWVDSRPAD